MMSHFGFLTLYTTWMEEVVYMLKRAVYILPMRKPVCTRHIIKVVYTTIHTQWSIYYLYTYTPSQNNVAHTTPQKSSTPSSPFYYAQWICRKSNLAMWHILYCKKWIYSLLKKYGLYDITEYGVYFSTKVALHNAQN